MCSPWSPGHQPQDNKQGSSLWEAALTASGAHCTSQGSQEVGEVKDECQELICCQTQRESTDGSTLLVANLVVV